MPTKPSPLAVICSDLHISLTAPACRPDWRECMERTFGEIRSLCGNWKCPLIVAGDLFDKWNPNPETINFAIKELPPEVYAVAGQHDLPYHNVSDIDKSGYGVLVLSERITDLGNLKDVNGYEIISHNHSLVMVGFPWNSELKMPNKEFNESIANENATSLAVVHAFVWMAGYGYVGVPQGQRISPRMKALKGFDFALFGDNHKGFHFPRSKRKYPTIWNNGTLMRRRIDEVTYRPRVGLLYRDRIETHYLNADKDKFSNDEHTEIILQDEEAMQDFIKELQKESSDNGDSYQDYLSTYLTKHEVPDRVKAILKQAIE